MGGRLDWIGKGTLKRSARGTEALVFVWTEERVFGKGGLCKAVLGRCVISGIIGWGRDAVWAGEGVDGCRMG